MSGSGKAEPRRRVTDAQRRALKLIQSGQYVYNPQTGGAQHHTLTRAPGIARRTLLVIVEGGLAEYDELVYGALRLTETGRAALVP